ncbi:hypothetical protein E2C01_018702 [Portunus trituberculatus]|uniref:Uncharacterized protein n=1 Tax=Portunus trituberculatus TaxID=210409 RepID=A0A5B7DWD3_PORTR|nr:hypothetical protein [Portunus trituberculatus]
MLISYHLYKNTTINAYDEAVKNAADCTTLCIAVRGRLHGTICSHILNWIQKKREIVVGTVQAQGGGLRVILTTYHFLSEHGQLGVESRGSPLSHRWSVRWTEPRIIACYGARHWRAASGTVSLAAS